MRLIYSNSLALNCRDAAELDNFKWVLGVVAVAIYNTFHCVPLDIFIFGRDVNQKITEDTFTRMGFMIDSRSHYTF